MAGDRPMWRYLGELWERSLEKDWELGPVKRANLPLVVAEFGPYLLALHCRDGETVEGLLEARDMHEHIRGRGAPIVARLGLYTPEEVERLLENYGLAPDGSLSGPATSGTVSCRPWCTRRLA